MEPRPTGNSGRSPARGRRAVYWLALFPLLSGILLGPSLTGRVTLLPADQLAGFHPWSTQAEQPPEAQWNVLEWDGMAEFLPWRLFLARSLYEGRIPLWNPYVALGIPFLANSQSAPLYPPHLLALSAWGQRPDPAAVALRLAWLAFLHLTLAGGFTYLLLRESGLGSYGSAAGGAVFQLSAFAAAWLALPSFIAVTCWMPLLLLAVRRLSDRPGARNAAWAALAAGLMLLAGHLQLAFYGLLAAGLGAVARAAQLARLEGPVSGGAFRSALRRLAWTAAALSAGLLLAAPQVLPSVELSRISHRAAPPSETGYDGYVGLALPVQNLVTLLVPDFYGMPRLGNYWGYWQYGPPNVMEYAGATNLAAFALALTGLLLPSPGRGARWFPALLAVLALALALGTPLCRAFYFLVPGFSQSGSPARCLVLFCLCQGLMAGMAVDRLASAAETSERRPWVIALCAGAATVVLALVARTAALTALLHKGLRPEFLADQVRQVGDPALLRAIAGLSGVYLVAFLLRWLLRSDPPARRQAACGSALAAGLAAIGLFGASSYRASASPENLFPQTALTRSLAAADTGRAATLNDRWNLLEHPRALLPPNSSIAYGWRELQGYDSLLPSASRRLLDLTAPEGAGASPRENGNIFFVKEARLGVLRELGVDRIISMRLLPPDPGVELGEFRSPPYVYHLPGAAPARLHLDWEVLPAAEGAARLRSARPDVWTRPTVDPATPPGSPDGPARFVRPASVMRPTANHMRIAAAVPSDALLVVAETYQPGWRARLGPRRAALPVVKVNGGLLGVRIPARGGPTVELSYEPASFRLGVFLALLAGALLAGAARATRDTGAR